MDGLNLKFARSPLEGNFTFDKYGSLIPSQDNLQMEKVVGKIDRQLRSDTGLYKRMTELYYKTDVEFTDNPYGNTPTLGVGLKLYGKRPLNVSFRKRTGFISEGTPSIQKELDRREAKIVQDQKAYMDLYDSLKPAEDSEEYVSYLVEGDQVMTGGGFDGNTIGDVNKSALNFVVKGNNHVEYADTPFSQYTVQGAQYLRSKIEEAGIAPGSLKPMGCTEVRMNQDNDGMITFPVYEAGWKLLTKDLAVRLLIDSSVDVRNLVNRHSTDPRTGEDTGTMVVQALGVILDQTVISDPSDYPAIVSLLARIQKHGWHEIDDNPGIEPKKPKTRSVYPNSALAGMIEAMVGEPFIKAIQDHKFSFMPSLQDKPTRVGMIKEMYSRGRAAGYEWLSLDESQYDATCIGAALATVMYYAVRPFFNAQYYDWVDFAIYTLVYKYIVCDTALININQDLANEARASGPYQEVGPFTVFGMTDGLISGAKFTHVGGSFYGGAVIHYAMPKMMGFEPYLGVQAGDDCVWAYPKDRVDFEDRDATYGPVEAAAKNVGIEINTSKQIWHVVQNELVNIFLQDTYHETTNTWGVGSIFRPLTAVFFSERDKGLSIAEQFMAEIARMEQGADNPFAAAAVRAWLEKEEFIGILFKEFGVSAFDRIIESIGVDWKEILQRIDVGSFTFGVSKQDLELGTLKILPIIADVSSGMEFKQTLQQALKSIGEIQSSTASSEVEEVLPEDDPTLEDGEV